MSARMDGSTTIAGITIPSTAPWFLAVFHREPRSFDFMVYGQAVGHALGTTIRNRRGPLLYYLAILGFGCLPWTWRTLGTRSDRQTGGIP